MSGDAKAAPASTSAGADAITRDRPIRVGILGASWIAGPAVIDAAKPIAKLITPYAIAARSKIRATQFAAAHGVAVVHDSYQAVVDDPKVDAVYIGLQNSGHAEWAIKALNAGKHVLCEKPMACNQYECKAISAAAVANKRFVCLEAFHYRYHPLMRRVVELIASGAIGTAVRRVEAALCIFIRKLTSDIRFDYDLGGGSLMDTGPYAVHAVRTCLFTPVKGHDAPTPIALTAAKRAAEQGVDVKAAAAAAAAAADPFAEHEMDVTRASAKLLWPNVDQSARVELESADFLRDQSALIECSLRTLVPRVSLRVLGTGKGKIEVTNFVLPHMIYSSLTVTDPNGVSRSERVDHSQGSTYTCQLRAFAEAVHTAEHAHRQFVADSAAAAGDAKAKAGSGKGKGASAAAAAAAVAVEPDYQALIRAIAPTDHVDAVKNQRIADSVYIALGLPLRAPQSVPAGAAGATTLKALVQPKANSKARRKA